MNRRRLAGLALALTVAVAVVAVSSALASRSAPSQAARTAAIVRIKVKAYEFGFTFSTKRVTRGTTVIFTVRNGGAVPHDLSFSTLGKKTRLLDAGQSTTLRITFKKKGRFQYLCTVPRHAEQGMSGAFVVK
jgi:uncharacterized cupredoxin-like copper-binding protein